MDQLFLTFSAISVSNFSELSAGVFSWLEEYCKPQTLKETVYQVLRRHSSQLRGWFLLKSYSISLVFNAAIISLRKKSASFPLIFIPLILSCFWSWLSMSHKFCITLVMINYFNSHLSISFVLCYMNLLAKACILWLSSPSVKIVFFLLHGYIQGIF